MADLLLANPSQPSQPRRPTCRACLRAQSACICRFVVPLVPQVQVVILQHPLEVGHAKGSARLLHLSLADSSLHIGECFAAEQLQALLHDPAHETLLLYPDSVPATTTPTTTAPATISPAKNGFDSASPAAPFSPTGPRATAAKPIRLIVLDGTWRKSRKMLYCNPALQALPRFSLRDLPPSHYRLRKAHRPDQLSTLEAVCHALAQLEQDQAKYAPLLAAFDDFIDHLAQHWGG